jgi:excisionase family DNA binding protein
VEAIDTKKVSNDRTTKKTALQLMRHMKMIRDNPMTIDEAASLAKCSYHTIHRAIKKGDLAAYKPGKTVLILEKDLTNWFMSKKIHAVRIGKPRNCVKVHSGR